MKYVFKFWAGLSALVLVAVAPIDVLWAQTESPGRGQVILAHETGEQLLTMGCEKVLITDKQALESARLLGWYAVIPVDTVGEFVAVCAPQVVQRLKPVEKGEVKAWGVDIVPGVPDSVENWFAGRIGTGLLSAGNEAVVGALGALFEFLGRAGKAMFDLVAAVIPPLLTIGEFTESQAVKTFWPVVLGITNLGFLLALIIIALLVTLRSDLGGGIKKLLPRLLLGAIFINFSLIIGGAIIDFSRLLMVLIAQLLDAGAVDETLFARMYQASDINFLSIVTNRLGLEVAGWENVLSALIYAVIVWIMVLALAVIAFGLVVRYVGLLLLLIVSPVAYLALAFPGAQKIAMSWWSNFLRYVVYGPILLVTLLIVVNGTAFVSSDNFNLTNGRGQMEFLIMKVVLFVGGLIFAAVVGRYAGIAGSTMALNMATGAGKKVRSLAYRGTVGTGSRVVKSGAKLGVRTATAPARFAARGAKKQASAFFDAGKARVASRLGMAPGKTAGAALGEKMFGKPRTQGQKRQINDALNVARSTTGAARGTHATYNTSNLSRRHVGEEMAKSDVGRAALNDVGKHGDMENTRAMVRNKGTIENLNDQQRIDLQARVELNATMLPAEKANIINELHKTIASVEDDVSKRKA